MLRRAVVERFLRLLLVSARADNKGETCARTDAAGRVATREAAGIARKRGADLVREKDMVSCKNKDDRH